MNIVITGSSGLLGSHILEKLDLKKNNIYIITSNRNFRYEGANILLINLSKKISKNESKKINNFLPKIVHKFYHCASQVISSKIKDDLDLLKKNLNIAKNIIHLTHQITVHTFLNMSSISVSKFLKKKHKISKEYNYVLSKLHSELAFKNEIKCKNLLTLRISSILTKDKRGRGVINTLYNDLIKLNTITINSDKNRTVEYIEIELLIKKILRLSNLKGRKTFELIQRKIRLLDYAKILKKKLGNKDTKIIIKKI